MTIPGEILVAKRHAAFDRAINAVWESFAFAQFYLPHLHKLVKAGQAPTLSLRLLGNPTAKRIFDKPNTLGVISRIGTNSSPRQAIIDSVLIFEDYLGDLMHLVFSRFPGKLLSSDRVEASERQEKVIQVILQSSTKVEMIDILIEDKIRSVFYGDPIEFFSKDKGKLEFGTYFTDHHKKQLESLRELVALRNIIIHNLGKVDRKFLREVPSTKYRLNQKPVVDEPFVRSAIELLKGIGAAAAKLTIEKVFRAKAIGQVKSHYHHYCSKT